MSNDASSERRLQRRRLRLIAELADEDVNLQVVETDPLFAAIIDEIAYARWSPVHEERRNSYGALVGGTPEQLAHLTRISGDPIGRRIELSGTDPAERNIGEIRRMCNGRTTFLVRSTHGPECLLELSLQATEQGLARLVSPNTRVVQRTPGGVVKVFTPTYMYVFEHDEWRAKVYSSDAAHLIEQLFFPNGPAASVDVLKELLSFCLHILSARHIGATFVWFPDRAHPRQPTAGFPEQRPAALLQASHRLHVEPLASLLAAIDGACFVGPTGQIEHVAVRLSPSDRATALVAPESGMRHTSAKLYSFDHPGCIVFVVSQDGPVTVYSDGMSVLQLRAGPSYASSIGGVAHEHDMFGSRRPTSCPKCEKDLVVESVHGRHGEEPISVECPICRSPGLESDNALAMHAWPRKPWTERRVGAWLPEFPRPGC
jgi:DNA integrity scanning protein DisA with diadenylate cyclase activity